jgi:hypothetical protein
LLTEFQLGDLHGLDAQELLDLPPCLLPRTPHTGHAPTPS